MNIKQKGTIISKSENGDYGFIEYNDGEKIFFHARQTIETLDVDDRVLFEVGDSKRQPGKLEAFYIRKAYPQPNGFDLSLGKNLKVTPEAIEVVSELLQREIKLEKPSQEEVVFTRNLPDRAGLCLAIQTTSDDEIFYARRKGRKGYYRFVKNRDPERTTLFTVIINFVEDEEFYEVMTCYFGEKTPPAPWDKRATPEAVPFWQNHALIPHEIFAIDYSDVKLFDPDFFKSFEELQGKPDKSADG